MQDIASEASMIELSHALSNWGRWGEQDELGTLNHITEASRLRAAESTHTGETVACSWVIDPAGSDQVSRYMMSTTDATLVGAQRATHAAETLLLASHGLQVTHLSGLSHVAWDGRLYNNRSTDVVTTSRGAAAMGVESVANGIVTRGVLLDVAAARGVAALDLGHAVFPADLDAAEKRQDVRVEAGDAVVLSTGFSRYLRQHSDWTPDQGAPGYHATCLPWFHERQVALVAGDSFTDVSPSGYPSLERPIHQIGIPAMGLWLLNKCNLERLTELAAARRRSTFLFVVNPLRFVGATGSPVNPIAVL